MNHRVLAFFAALLMPLAVLVAVPSTATASSSASSGFAALAAWAPWTAYTTGTRVTYQGVEYECRQSHTSQPGWEPPNVLALWLPTGGGGGDTQAPSVPANLRSTGVTSTSVSLAWNASTDNVAVTGYEVYRGSTLITTVTGTSHTDSGLSADTAYTYTVRARDAAGNRSAAGAAVTARTSTGGGGDTQAPSVPANLRSTGVTSTSVSLAWNASTDNVAVTGYEVYRGST
ncbi:carbohydrate-binding protein, partial [Nonomuraea sp. NPDC048826]|uniref:carbohydrate-binding protein n=1 Tax=Nonomuraea sp. NPDC048826 TaxID=3364347 RepID=UPI003717BDE0